MDLIIDKGLFGNYLLDQLMMNVPDQIVLRRTFLGWDYRDQNFKLKIKRHLLGNDYRFSANLCGLKISKDVDGAIIDNLGLLKYIVVDFISRFCEPLDIMKIRHQDLLEKHFPIDRAVGFMSIALVIAYNTGKDVKFRYDDTKILIRFRDEITKVVIKNESGRVKSYYCLKGCHRDKCIALLEIF